MRERINRLAKGIIDTEIPELEISEIQSEEPVQPDSKTKREILITSINNLHCKGLVYSSNPRVKVLGGAFGGIRNRIAFEIDSSYLKNGDIIEGFLYLVTNAGEKEIPYSFKVEQGIYGQTLNGLVTAADFAKLAQRDMDTAIRLFEFQDFIEAPFMQNVSVRTIYDGLKGRGNRYNLLEEFLVALNVKPPVALTADMDDRVYDNPSAAVSDSILIEKSGWGYISIEVSAEGDFIQLLKRSVTADDFENDICELQFRINPERMHKGKNLGCIYLSTVKDTVRINIEASLGQKQEELKLKKGFNEIYSRYLSLRLDYESEIYDRTVILEQMKKELDRLLGLYGSSNLVSLFQAEVYILQDKLEPACLILDECRDDVLAKREEELQIYCFYQYLNVLTKQDETQKESLIRLLNKYMTDRPEDYLLFLLSLKLNYVLQENPGTLLVRMSEQYVAGCRSPFLYTEACKILIQTPEFLQGIGKFELQVLYYGARKGMITKELALIIADIIRTAKYYNSLYYRLLVLMFDKYECVEILEAVCAILIKGECRGNRYFPWYEAGINAGISLTRLYEYYLYTLSAEYDKLLPKEVLMYFSYDHELDVKSKSRLYTNILKYMPKDDPLYKDYERSIEKFAMEQLLKSRINSRLAVIYENIIYKDMIDENVARLLPAILKSYRISCKNSNMKYLIVRYEELTDEDAFVLENGVAYVPLFSSQVTIFFQDAYGNRYINAEYTRQRVMYKPELEKRCFELCPQQSMLRLQACRELMEQEDIDDEQAGLLEQSLEDMNIHPLFQRKLVSKIIAYYGKRTGGEEVFSGGQYLIHLDKNEMTKAERCQVCETFIAQNYIKQAYEMLKQYFCDGVRVKYLKKLCSKIILDNISGCDDYLVSLSYQVFEAGEGNEAVVDYLCEHYNGTSSQMYGILIQAVKEHIETYDMEERLTAQMIFSGADAKMDRVFDLYASRKKMNESIVRAFFTIKSYSYFIDDKPADDKVFKYLESAVKTTEVKGKIPVVYLLALTKYYSAMPVISDEQKTLCRTIMDILLEEEKVFPYFKELQKHIAMPEYIMDKGIFQYIGSKNIEPELKVRILPDEEDYHTEDIKRMYQGVYVKQKILFEGEIMEYQIFENRDGEEILMHEGSVTCELEKNENSNSRFACLNEMSLCLRLKEEKHLKEKMKEYLLKNMTIEEIFTLM